MKIKKVTLLDDSNKKLYKGALVGMNYKKSAIKRVCLEAFNDDNPCIIHESYALSLLADEVEQCLLDFGLTTIKVDDNLVNKLTDLELEPYIGCTLELEVKR